MSKSINRNRFIVIVTSSRVHYYLLSGNQRGFLLSCVAQYLHIVSNQCGSFVFTPIIKGMLEYYQLEEELETTAASSRGTMWCLGARNFYPVAVESERFQKPKSDACRKKCTLGWSSALVILQGLSWVTALPEQGRFQNSCRSFQNTNLCSTSRKTQKEAIILEQDVNQMCRKA